MNFNFLFLTLFCVNMLSCKEVKKVENLLSVMSLGDSITTIAQGELLNHLSHAIKDSGYVFAIDYCNKNASQIIENSIDNLKVLSVERLSDKNRNPLNAIKESRDFEVWEGFKKGANDTIINVNDLIYYYKPIKIMMPTCLKCHGVDKELDLEVIQTITSKYPSDLARGYAMGELRGMWKLKIRK